MKGHMEKDGFHPHTKHQSAIHSSDVITTQQTKQVKKYRPEINEIMRNLLQIEKTGHANINIALYRKMGLIETRHKHVKTGLTRTGEHKVFDRLILTEKGKRILSLVI